MLQKNREIRKLTLSAILIALSVVLTRFGSFYLPGANFIRIGFGSIPIIIASLVVGPIWGGLVGAGADLIGSLAFPVGPYFFGYTIDAALQGILPFFVMFFFKGKTKYQHLLSIILITIFIAIISAFTFRYSSYRSYKLLLWLRYAIPVFFLLYFIVIYIFIHYISRTKAFHWAERHERKFSLLDIYLMCLVNEIIISMGFLGMWNYLNPAYGLEWLINAFSQGLMFTINSILRTFILYFILNSIFKLDNTMSTTLKI